MQLKEKLVKSLLVMKSQENIRPLWSVYAIAADWPFPNGIGCFAINIILLLEAILPSPIMCVYIALIAIFLAVMLQRHVMQWLQIGILAGRALRERQCPLKWNLV